MLPKTAKDTKDSQSRLDFFLMFNSARHDPWLASHSQIPDQGLCL